MYSVDRYFEEENGIVVFEVWQIFNAGFLVCESERESEALNIAQKLNAHDYLIKALKECKHWHQGDKWRQSDDPEQKGAWNRHMQIINDALDNQ